MSKSEHNAFIHAESHKIIRLYHAPNRKERLLNGDVLCPDGSEASDVGANHQIVGAKIEDSVAKRCLELGSGFLIWRVIECRGASVGPMTVSAAPGSTAALNLTHQSSFALGAILTLFRAAWSCLLRRVCLQLDVVELIGIHYGPRLLGNVDFRHCGAIGVACCMSEDVVIAAVTPGSRASCGRAPRLAVPFNLRSASAGRIVASSLRP